MTQKQFTVKVPLSQCELVECPCGSTRFTKESEFRQVPFVYRGKGMPDFIEVEVLICAICTTEYPSVEDVIAQAQHGGNHNHTKRVDARTRQVSGKMANIDPDAGTSLPDCA